MGRQFVIYLLTLVAASLMIAATASGCEIKTAWLPDWSTVLALARPAIIRCAGTGIILSSVATRYQLGLLFQAGTVTSPFTASIPHGT